MCACIQLSLVGLLVMSSRHLCDMSWLGVLVCIYFFFFLIFLIWFGNTLYCLCIMMRLFTLDGCGDYRQVWCVAFFSKTSILVVSFGLHQWIKLVDLISMYLAQLVVCSDCREGARQRFLSMFSRLFTIVNIAAEEPSVEHAKVFLHTSCTNDWLRPVRSCLSLSACWCLNIPLVSNLTRMSCNHCALVMCDNRSIWAYCVIIVVF